MSMCHAACLDAVSTVVATTSYFVPWSEMANCLCTPESRHAVLKISAVTGAFPGKKSGQLTNHALPVSAETLTPEANGSR